MKREGEAGGEAEGTPAQDAELGRRASGLAGALSWAVSRSLDAARGAAVAFSGGVDSSLLSHLAVRSGKPIVIYTAGLPGAPDIAASARAARLLGMEDRLRVIELAPGEVLEAAGRISAVVPGASLLEVSFLAPSFIVFERAREGLVLTGDGADELFGGYHRYLSMGPAELSSALERDARALVSGGFERNRRLAERAGKVVAAPYLDPEVVELARSIPAELKVRAGERKAVLRRAAALLGLPPELCALPKRAAQYGTGIHALLKRRRSMQRAPRQ